MLKRRSEVILAILASLFVAHLLYPSPEASHQKADLKHGGERISTESSNLKPDLTSHPTPKIDKRTDGHTSLTLKSAKADYIGGGHDWHFTQDNATFEEMRHDAVNGVRLNIHTKDHDDYLTLSLGAPGNQPLRVGRYAGATRYAFHLPAEPGLDFSGWARGSNQVSGEFEVLEIADGPDGPTRFAANFVQYSEKMKSQRLDGSIRYHSLIP